MCSSLEGDVDVVRTRPRVVSATASSFVSPEASFVITRKGFDSLIPTIWTRRGVLVPSRSIILTFCAHLCTVSTD